VLVVKAAPPTVNADGMVGPTVEDVPKGDENAEAGVPEPLNMLIVGSG
jgi:hypothetical protein